MVGKDWFHLILFGKLVGMIAVVRLDHIFVDHRIGAINANKAQSPKGYNERQNDPEMRHRFVDQEIQKYNNRGRSDTSKASLPTQQRHIQSVLQHFLELNVKGHGNQIDIKPHDVVDQAEEQNDIERAERKQATGCGSACMIRHQVVNDKDDHESIQNRNRKTHAEILFDHRKEIAPGGNRLAPGNAAEIIQHTDG